MRGADAPRGRPLRVLIVEDSENDAMLLLRELRRGGYEPHFERVYTPEDMEGALQGAEKRGEAFEVVISDYYMPRFRAPDALALLRGLGHDTPFIVVSGKIGEDAAVGIMKAGADDYLTKENMSRLCPAIERELAEAEVRRERERAEEALRRSEDRFRTLVEQIPAVTYVQEPVESDNPKAITYMSPQYEAMLGYAPEKETLDEEHWLKVLHPADRERVLAEELRTDETGEPYRMEYRQIARDGRVVWVRDQATLVRDEGGRPLYWLGVQYDITDQKQAVEELRRSEDRYRTFIEQSTEGIWRFELEEPLPLDSPEEEQLDHIYRHTYLAECNDAMARMYGYEHAEELVGARLGDLLPRSEPENVEYLRAFMNSGYRLADTESRGLDRYGNPRVFLNNLTGIVEDGCLVRAWGTQRDVTEQKEAEEALRESEERFRLLADEAVAGIVLIENGAIFDANKSFTRMFGYEPGELLGLAVTEFVLPEDREKVARRVSSGNTEAYEIRGLRKDGTVFPVEVRPRQLPYKGRRVRLTSVIDLTERKRAQEELEESEERHRVVAETASDAIVMIDEESRILFINGAAEHIFGYAREEMLEQELTMLMPEHLRNTHRTALKRYLDTRRRHLDWNAIQLPGLHNSGREIPLEVSFGEFVKEGRRFFTGFMRDITERKAVEEALRMSEQRFRTIIDQSPLSIQILSPDGLTVRVNRAWEELWGATLDDLAGYNILEDPQLVEKGIMPYIRKGFAGESTLIPPVLYDPEETIPDLSSNAEPRRWVRAFIYPVEDEARQIREVILVHEDITDRKRAEEQARFLADVNQALRLLTDPDEIMATTARMLGEHLGADRCAYAEVEADEDHFRLIGDYTVDVPSIVGRFAMSQFGSEALRLMRVNEPYVVADVEADERVGAKDLPAYQQTQIRAVVSVPLHKGGRFVAGMAVHQKTPRHWSREEVELVTTVTNRCWESIERSRAEKALRASEERFRAAFEQAAVGMAQVDLDGRWLRVNQKLCEIVGYTAEEMRGLTFQDITHPEDLESDLDYVARLLAGEIETYSIEKRYFRKDGSTVWIDLTVSLVRGPAGDPRYFVSVIEDISERKRTEAALNQSEELYRTVVEQAAENIFLADAETGRVLESNAALQTSLGYTAEELNRMTLYEIVASDRHSVDHDIVRVMEEGRSSLGERQYRRKDGSLADVEVNVSAVPYDGRRVMCILAHDVTERKRAERALEEIREAERNRIARELHDSTLQDIVYALQEIQIVQAVSENGGNPALEDTAEALRRSVEGLRGAIFELRLEETLGRSFVSSLESLVDLNRRMARGRYELELVVEDDFPSGLTGRVGREITRIVQEALTNVRRHAEAEHASVRMGLDGEVVYVEVSDDGRGFVTERPRVGVGQHSMHQRALQVGGDLEVESEPGEGTRVRFRIPLSRLTQG